MEQVLISRLYPGGIGPFGQVPNPNTFDDASIHSLSTTENISHSQRVSNSQQTAQTKLPLNSNSQAEGNMSSRNLTAQSAETGYQSSKSWPTQANSAQNKASRRNPERHGSPSKPVVPPLGLVSESTSVASSSDMFAQTLSNTESRKRAGSIQKTTSKAGSGSQCASVPNSNSIAVDDAQNTGTYRVDKSKTSQ